MEAGKGFAQDGESVLRERPGILGGFGADSHTPISSFHAQSWSGKNLYDLIARSARGPHSRATSFTQSSQTMYQQRWASKRFLRSYHGDHIPETKFKRWFLPIDLPTFQNPAASGSKVPRATGIFKELRGAETSQAQLPIASLFVREVERRLDTVVFRCCFARSVYEARALVIQGKVKLNGVKKNDPNHLLEPGDMITVDAKSIPTLQSQKQAKKVEATESAEEIAEAASTAEEQAESSETAESAEAKSRRERAEKRKAEKAEKEAQREAARAKKMEKSPEVRINKPGVLQFKLPFYAAPFLFVPPYLEVSFAACSAIYMRHPTLTLEKARGRAGEAGTGKSVVVRSDIPSPYPADGELFSLAWEHYVKNSPRTRSDERRLKREAKEVRNGFVSQRAKEEYRRRRAVRRGYLKRPAVGVASATKANPRSPGVGRVRGRAYRTMKSVKVKGAI